MANTKFTKSEYWFEEGLESSLAEVPLEEIQSWPKDKKLHIVGKGISRVDGEEKCSGVARYTYDINFPRMAHLRFLRSSIPHAKIKAIDASRAEKLNGVYAVMTHHNAPEIKWYGDQSLLFDTTVRYEGDEIAAVVADTPVIAEQAVKLIKIELEELPFNVDTDAALKEGAPLIHGNSNMVGDEPFTYQRGDFDQAIAGCAAIIEETYRTPVVVHNPTEYQCSVVRWEDDHLTVWDSTQAVYSVRNALAYALNMPDSKIRVIKKYMGGGFGSKLGLNKQTVVAALIAKQIGRPVSVSADRREMNLCFGNRPDSVQTLKMGAKKDGTLLAMSHHSYGAVGAYRYGAGCSWPLRQLYLCPNVKVEESSLYINAGKGRAFRAPGHVQGTFGLDSAIDLLAAKLDMDPLDFRLKNYAEKDQMYNIPYTSKKLKEAYLAGAKAIGWEKRNHPNGTGEGRYRTGIGMASQIWWGGGGPPAHAILKLNRDGSLEVLAGTQDIGTGTYTWIAQIISEVLEIQMNKINVVLGDTGVVPFGPGSGGSTTAPSVSPAIRHAAEQMKDKLLQAAAPILKKEVNELVYKDGSVTAKGDPANSKSISQIMREMREETLITHGLRNANPERYMIQTFGAQFAEVEVDTWTGKIRVKKVVAANDIGRVLNRKLLENQFHGGIMQGIGFALMEERILDKNTGKSVNANFHDYKIPLITDTPEIEVIIVSDSDPMISNTGVKGCGEPAHIPTPAAIANAVFNAIGIQMKSAPMTPDKVLMALNGKN